MKTNPVVSFLLTWLVMLASLVSYAQRTYYVNAVSGNDKDDGSSDALAWQSLSKVNAAQLLPGDQVLFRRGQIWRGQLIPQSGHSGTNGRIVYGAYPENSDPLPQLLGSVHCLGWTNQGGNVWRCHTDFAAYGVEVGNLIFNDGQGVGIKRRYQSEVNSQDEFWFDPATKALKLYSTDDPAKRYRSLEAALTRNIIDIPGKAYITIQDLELKYGAAHGVFATNVTHITVLRCTFRYIGGGYLYLSTGPERYGNGIEFWAGANNCQVNRCRFYDIFDTGVTNQFSGSTPVDQYNIDYFNNLFVNNGLASLEFFNHSSGKLRNIRVYNNTSVFAGYGWGNKDGVQRQGAGKLGGGKVGAHVSFTGHSFDTSANAVQLRNNIFYAPYDMFIFRLTQARVWQGTRLSNNIYYCPECYDANPATTGPKRNKNLLTEYNAAAGLPQDQRLRYVLWEGLTTDPDWTGKDAKGYRTDPRFVDPFSDYRLRSDSPGRGAGYRHTAAVVGADIKQNRRQNPVDLGAYCYGSASAQRAATGNELEFDVAVLPSAVTTGQLNFCLKDPDVNFKLVNMLGEEVLRQKGVMAPIDVSGLELGTYMMTTVREGVEHRTKVLILP